MAGTEIVSWPPSQSVGSIKHVLTPILALVKAAANAAEVPPTITTLQSVSMSRLPLTPTNNAHRSKLSTQ